MIFASPQLEALLNLPPGALTKQISLTQQLLELFVEYQIPSDLLAYDGDADAPPAEKLEAVKAHVAALFASLDDAKAAEVQAARMEHDFAHPGRPGARQSGRRRSP